MEKFKNNQEKFDYLKLRYENAVKQLNENNRDYEVIYFNGSVKVLNGHHQILQCRISKFEEFIKELEQDVINEDNLLRIGFKKHYANDPNGFYMLDTEKKKLEDNFIFTVDFKDMILSLGTHRHNAIKKLPHIKTIHQIEELYYMLTDEYINY